MIAVRPSLKSSPVIVRSLLLAGAAVLAYWFRVRVSAARNRQVGAALDRVDVVAVRDDHLADRIVVLHGDLDFNGALVVAAREDDRRVQRRLGAVEVGDELAQPLGREELGVPGLVAPLVGQADPHALVEEGQLAEPLLQRVVVEVDLGEDLGVGQEADLRAGGLGRPEGADRALGLALLVLLLPDLAVAADLGLQPLREGVDDRDAHAVQAAGDLVGVVVELAAGVDLGQHDLQRALAAVGVDVDRDAAAVVDDRDRAVGVERDVDVPAVAGHRLVDRVVDDLVDQVVQAARGRVADVHARALPDRLDPLEDPDVRPGVGRPGGRRPSPASRDGRSGLGRSRRSCSSIGLGHLGRASASHRRVALAQVHRDVHLGPGRSRVVQAPGRRPAGDRRGVVARRRGPARPMSSGRPGTGCRGRVRPAGPAARLRTRPALERRMGHVTFRTPRRTSPSVVGMRLPDRVFQASSSSPEARSRP